MRVLAWASLLMLLCPARASAACNEAGLGLGCFDAVPGQGPGEPSRFQWFSEGKALAAREWALTLNGRYAHAPAQLAAPSGDPDGRTVNVVARSLRLELRSVLGLGYGIDAQVAAPLAVYQRGTGSESLSSQNPEPIASAGLGDLRLQLRSNLPRVAPFLDWNLRLEVAVPTGNEEAYLGGESSTETVAANLAFSYAPLLVVADLGGRITKARRFADVAMGSHLLLGLGVAVDILAKGALTAALEGQARPMLSSSPKQESDDSVAIESQATQVIPTEWMLSVSSRPTKEPLWFSIGAGTALPLSSREAHPISASTSTEPEPRLSGAFIAPTSPRFSVSSSVSLKY